jgi:hypothetical protein
MEINYFAFLKYLIRFNRQVYLDHTATMCATKWIRR